MYNMVVRSRFLEKLGIMEEYFGIARKFEDKKLFKNFQEFAACLRLQYFAFTNSNFGILRSTIYGSIKSIGWIRDKITSKKKLITIKIYTNVLNIHS